MAPQAKIISGEYDGNSEILFYNNPADIEANYNSAINSYGAELANNSIGMNIQGNRLSTEYYGDYETTCILIDNIATGCATLFQKSLTRKRIKQLQSLMNTNKTSNLLIIKLGN